VQGASIGSTLRFRDQNADRAEALSKSRMKSEETQQKRLKQLMEDCALAVMVKPLRRPGT